MSPRWQKSAPAIPTASELARSGFGSCPSAKSGFGFRPSAESGFGFSPSGGKKRPGTSKARTLSAQTSRIRTRVALAAQNTHPGSLGALNPNPSFVRRPKREPLLCEWPEPAPTFTSMSRIRPPLTSMSEISALRVDGAIQRPARPARRRLQQAPCASPAPSPMPDGRNAHPRTQRPCSSKRAKALNTPSRSCSTRGWRLKIRYGRFVVNRARRTSAMPKNAAAPNRKPNP